MVRSKVKLAFIEDSAARSVSFKKRNRGLIKKTREISILCFVDACSIVYNPNKPDEPIVWPSVEEAKRIIMRFRALPESKRRSKMMNRESYMKERISKLEEKLTRMRKENHHKELLHLIFSWIRGEKTKTFTLSELKDIVKVVDEKISEINWRIQTIQDGARKEKRETVCGEAPRPGVVVADGAEGGTIC